MSTELFDTPTVAEPEPVRPPDYWTLYAVAKCGAPEGWRPVVLDCSKTAVPEGYLKMEGAVCPSDKHGIPVWRKRERGTEKVLFIKLAELDVWKAEYAAAQGKCWKCWGSGQEVASFGVGGTKYRTCGRCDGSGKPRV